MIFSLIQDFAYALGAMPTEHPRRRILKLLEEAIRRDVHFIHQHPTTLFQCLWNTCWWYDCPEAAEHYDVPEGGWTGPPPWGQDGLKLSQYVEQWMATKETTYPGFSWLRSRRPPSVHLGTAQSAVLEHDDWVQCVSFSPDGRAIASGSNDQKVHVWNAQTGELRASMSGHDFVYCVAFSPDGQQIASGSSKKTVSVWDVNTGVELLTLDGHADTVHSVVYSPDGRYIASASHDRFVRLWDSRTGALLAAWSPHPEVPVFCLAYSPDGRKIAGACVDSVRIWNSESGAELLVLRGHEDSVHNVAFSRDGALIASASDRTIRLWHAVDGRELVVLSGHTDRITGVAFSPEGERIASVSQDKTVRMWDIRSGSELAVFRGHEGEVTGLSFSPDGKQVATSSLDCTIRVWNSHGGSGFAAVCQHGTSVNCVSFSPDGSRVASGSGDWGGSDNTIRVWDANSGVALLLMRGHLSHVKCVGFSPDGRQIVSGANDNTVRVWDAQSGAELAVLRGHGNSVLSVSFSPNGRWIASGSLDDTVRIWDTDSGIEMAVLPANVRGVHNVSFSPDGRKIAARGDLGTFVRVWDSSTFALLESLPYMKTAIAGLLEVSHFISPEMPVFSVTTPEAWRPISLSSETMIQDVASGRAIAWFPIALEHDHTASSPIISHTASRLWAGSVRNHVYLISLEGSPEGERPIDDIPLPNEGRDGTQQLPTNPQERIDALITQLDECVARDDYSTAAQVLRELQQLFRESGAPDKEGKVTEMLRHVEAILDPKQYISALEGLDQASSWTEADFDLNLNEDDLGLT
jgi:WD40 repeat protein